MLRLTVSGPSRGVYAADRLHEDRDAPPPLCRRRSRSFAAAPLSPDVRQLAITNWSICSPRRFAIGTDAEAAAP